MHDSLPHFILAYIFFSQFDKEALVNCIFNVFSHFLNSSL